MAHMIDLSNYRENMAYTGKTPWHGLGQELTVGAPLEVWATEAGMGHTIERTKVLFGDDEGIIEMPERHVLYRSDNKAPLSVVSPRYQIVQPGDVLEFFRDLVDVTGEYDLETAGCLDGGKKYWALARHRGDMNFAGDVVRPYLLLSTSCDGTMATTAQHTSVRVVCNNTLQMSLHAGKADAVKVGHNTSFDGDRVRSQLNVGGAIATFEEDVNALIDKVMSREAVVETMVELVATRNDKGQITNETNTKKVVGDIMASLQSGPGADLSTCVGTAWGAMNAVTNYIDFKARAHDANNRFKSGQFGAGASFKQKAYDALMAA